MNKENFLKDVNDWSNHRPLLWLALEETQTGDVVELGCGDGSTRQLHEYCKDAKRVLFSFDFDKEWLEKFSVEFGNVNHKFTYVENRWEIAKETCPHPSVILIDHSPGDRRVVDIMDYVNMNGIMVVHDTQPKPTAAEYGFELIWKHFKYKVDLTCPVNPEPAPDGTLHNRTWASAVSNTHDVTKWKGLTFNNGDYVIR